MMLRPLQDILNFNIHLVLEVLWERLVLQEDWTQFMALAAWGFVVFFTSMYYAHESPRFLAASGRAADAARVLKEMYQSNGQGVWVTCLKKQYFFFSVFRSCPTTIKKNTSSGYLSDCWAQESSSGIWDLQSFLRFLFGHFMVSSVFRNY